MQKSFSTQAVLGAAVASVWAGSLALAGNPNTLIQGTDLSNPANWSLGTVPTINDDAIIGTTYPTTTATLTLSGSTASTFNGSFNSLNVTNARAITIQNFTGANPNTATLTLGGAGSTGNSFAPTVGGNAADLLYVGSSSTLTLSSLAGTAALALVAAQSGNFNIAGTATVGGTLNVASGSTLTANVAGTLNLGGAVTVGAGTTLVKNGAGTLNFTGGNNSSSFTGALTINAGTVEYVSAATAPAAGAAVTLSGGTLQYSNPGNQFVSSNGRFNITLTGGTTSGLGVRNTSTTGNRLINAYGTSGAIISGAGNLNITGSTVTSPSAVEFLTANTYTGSTNVGTLQMLLLGASGSAASSALNLSGGTLGVLTTHATGSLFNGVTFGPGQSVLETFSSNFGTVTPGTTGAGTYNIGTISRQAGSTADAFTSSVFQTSSANSVPNGIAGGYLTAGGGTAFGTIDSSGLITAYNGYTAASANYGTANASTDFDATASGTLTNSTVNSVRFNAAAPITLTSPALTVASGGVLVTANVGANATNIAGGTITSGNGADLIIHQYNNVAGGATTIDSGIVDNGSAVALTKAGPGTVILNGNNTFTGATYINGGTLQVGNGNTLGGINFNSPISDYGTLAINRSDDITLSGLVSGTGGLLKSGAGTLTLTNANNSFTGQIEVAQGVLAFSNTLALNGNSTLNRLLIDDGATLRYTNAGGFILAKGVVLNGGLGTIDTTSGTLTISGVITKPTGGSGQLIKTGTGTLVLSNTNNDYTGVLVSAGTLRVSAVGGLGLSGQTAANTPIVNEVANNATLEFNTSITYSGARNFQLDGPNSTIGVNTGTISIGSNAFLSGSGALNKAGTGTLTVNSASSYTGGTIVKAGTLNGAAGAFGSGDLSVNPASTTANATVNSNGAIAASGNVTVNNNGSALGTLNLNDAAPVIGSLSGNGQVNLGTATLLTVGNGSSTTFSGTLSGTGSSAITKVGAGTLALTGTVTYGGATTVTGGTLVLGAAAQAPALTNAAQTDIQNGQINFDYSGTSPAGTIRSLLAGSFAAGSGVMNTGQIHSTTATSARGLGYMDTGSTVIVKATLFGDADLDGGVSINDFNALAGNFGKASGQVWVNGDFDYDGGVSINDFNLLAGNFGKTTPASSEAWAGLLAFAAAHNDLVAFEAVTGVPEPTTIGLVAAGATLGLRRRRRAC